MIWWKRPGFETDGSDRLAIQLYHAALSEKPIVGLSEMCSQCIDIVFGYWIAKMREIYLSRTWIDVWYSVCR